MHSDLRLFLDRISSAVLEGDDLSKLPEWLCDNTRDPGDPDKMWSFDDHEYQIDILRDTANHVSTQKCSQVGASELFIRMVLGMLAIKKAMTAIYTLPTSGFARKFVKGRMDPAIAGSKALKAMLNPDVDSSELKQFGNSFLYILGSFGQSSAISVPAHALFKDEVDFSNQTVLTTFNSRLGHAKDGGIIREFSTPTVFNFGINKSFQEGSQHHYGVHCKNCNDYCVPDFMEDVEIPGFDGSIKDDFEKEDLKNTSVRIQDAFLRCPVCRSPLDWEDVLNPGKRIWVARYPDRDKHSYQIQPFDVPAVNPLARTLTQIEEYERKADWVNFKVGQPFEDAENSFLGSVIDGCTRGDCVTPPATVDDDFVHRLVPRSVIGMDVGKTSWILVGVPTDKGVDIVWAERIRQDDKNYLVNRFLFLARVFNCVSAVVDAGPDFTSSKAIVGKRPGKFWACYYRQAKKGSLHNLDTKPEEGTVIAFRTGTFNELARQVNTGYFNFRNFPDKAILKDHLTNIKKVDTQNDMGEVTSSWVKSGDDHYAHALNYLNMAKNLLGSNLLNSALPVLPNMSKIKIKDGFEEDKFGRKHNKLFE